MTPTWWAGLSAGLAATGLLLIGSRIIASRQLRLTARVLPYLRDLPQLTSTQSPFMVPASPVSAASGIFGPLLRSAADLVERLLGSSASLSRRLERAGLATTLHEFRISQVLWGLSAFAVMAGIHLIRALGGAGSPGSAVVSCLVAFVAGGFVREQRLSAQVKKREREILVEFPTIAELLALAVAAGESPVAALDRVVRRSHGELAADLGGVLANIRTGQPVAEAFDGLAATTGLPLVARFATGVAGAMERGTPLADVMHAQAADVREAGRRELIESAARKEVLMMAPVVFLVLPVTILFAFFPGVVGLRLVTP